MIQTIEHKFDHMIMKFNDRCFHATINLVDRVYERVYRAYLLLLSKFNRYDVIYKLACANNTHVNRTHLCDVRRDVDFYFQKDLEATF
jgi:hypothetical protein